MKLNEYLRLEKPLYGMCDSEDYWGATLTDYVRNHIKMVPLTGDPSLYIEQVDSKTIRILGSYVDDCLFAGDWSFNVFIEQFRKKFESNPVEWDNLSFLGYGS